MKNIVSIMTIEEIEEIGDIPVYADIATAINQAEKKGE